MRATLWMAATGFLLASGSARAGTGSSPDHEVPASAPASDRADASADAPAAPEAVTSADQDAHGSARDVAGSQRVAPAPDPRGKAEARSNAVTFDPDHPGGEFPWGG